LEKEEQIVRVKDLMTRKLVSIPAEKSVMDAAKLMTERDVSSILLRSGDEFIGLATNRDIIGRVVARGLNPREVKVGEVMSKPLVKIGEDASVDEAARRMRDNKVRRLVVEGSSGVVGIISETDLVRVEPELHFLIRERSRLGVSYPSDVGSSGVSLAGVCEECEVYSGDLKNVDGRWLCEDCRSS
jgi:CBS domain-containing protein